MSTPMMFDQAAVVAGWNPQYIPPGFDGYFRQPFIYNVNFLAAANGSVTTGTTNIQNDSYFVCVEQNADIWDSATGNTTHLSPDGAAMLVRIVDTSSGKFIVDQPTPIGNWFGTGLRPFVWLARAQVYRPGGQIQVELTQNMAASQNVRCSFIGFKVYYNVPDDFSKM